ncbi:hypothetical protein HMH01_08795 [Halovulum dunhuangense]|uniref:Dolichyl-phosphate-mannose-protein mannosyltransferase n=1 Tax=Halovulum dunhuangense TaxID=1505036 RepID=A0A849L2U8_9RHOB|nr:hypothetical protein [Halovulum dunhuangense]NNU80537.1 hypothetical protein [Halovulum dunhuangense]
MLLILLVYSGFQREFVDDTLITFVYARNFVEHGFPYWHPDLPPVDGFTSAGHMLALAALHATGLGLVAANSILMFGAGALIIWLYLGAVRGLSLAAQIGGGLVIVLNSSLAAWTGAGLDGIPYAAVFFATYLALERAISLGRFTPSLTLALCALALMRPEGQIIGLGILAFWIALLVMRRVGRGGLGWLPVVLVLILGIFAVRMTIYGHPLPNTFYAKSGDRMAELEAGLYYLWGWLVTGAGLLSIAIPLAVLRGSGGWLRLLFLLGNIALVAVAGGDSHIAFRFMLPVLPLIAMDVAWLLNRVETRRIAAVLLLVPFYLALQGQPLLAGRPPLAALQASLAAIGKGEWPMREIGHASNAARDIAAAKELSFLFPPDTPIAATDVGALAYGLDQPVIDALGLNNPDLAHLPKLDGEQNRWGLPRVALLAEAEVPVFHFWFPSSHAWSASGIIYGEESCSVPARMFATFVDLGGQALADNYALVSVPASDARSHPLNLVVHQRELVTLSLRVPEIEVTTEVRDFAEICAESIAEWGS